MTLQQLYQHAKKTFSQAGLESPAFDAICLLEHVFGLGRQALILHGDEPAPSQQIPAFLSLVQKRAARQPLQYLLGEWPFLSLTLSVGQGVLIPREDTELLVHTAVQHLPESVPLTVLDLCAGSGAVGLGVVSMRPKARVTCVERFDAAWHYLQQNTAKYQTKFPVQTIQADILDPLTPTQFSPVDAILSNPPYITTADLASLQAEVLREPATALDGGPDGLLFYRALASLWAPLLKPSGFLAVEIGEGQAQAVRQLFSHAGLAHCETFCDLSGMERVILACRSL